MKRIYDIPIKDETSVQRYIARKVKSRSNSSNSQPYIKPTMITEEKLEYKKEENFHQERNEDVRRVCNYNIYQIQEYFEGEMAKLSLLLENNVIIPGLNNQKDINSSKKEVEELKKEVNYINEIAKGLEDENKLLKSSLRTKDNEIATY